MSEDIQNLRAAVFEPIDRETVWEILMLTGLAPVVDRFSTRHEVGQTVKLVNRYGRALKVERRIRDLFVRPANDLDRPSLADVEKKVLRLTSSTRELMEILDGTKSAKLDDLAIVDWFDAGESAHRKSMWGDEAVDNATTSLNQYTSLMNSPQVVCALIGPDGDFPFDLFQGRFVDMVGWFYALPESTDSDFGSAKFEGLQAAITVVDPIHGPRSFTIDYQRLESLIRMRKEEVDTTSVFDFLPELPDSERRSREAHIGFARLRQFKSGSEEYSDPIGMEIEEVQRSLMAIHTVLEQNLKAERQLARFVNDASRPDAAKGMNHSTKFRGEFSYLINTGPEGDLPIHVPGSHTLMLGHVLPLLFRNIFQKRIKKNQTRSSISGMAQDVTSELIRKKARVRIRKQEESFDENELRRRKIQTFDKCDEVSELEVFGDISLDEAFGNFAIAVAEAWGVPFFSSDDVPLCSDGLYSAMNSIDEMVWRLANFKGVDIEDNFELPSRDGLDEESRAILEAMMQSRHDPKTDFAIGLFGLDALAQLPLEREALSEFVKFWALPFKPSKIAEK